MKKTKIGCKVWLCGIVGRFLLHIFFLFLVGYAFMLSHFLISSWSSGGIHHARSVKTWNAWQQHRWLVAVTVAPVCMPFMQFLNFCIQDCWGNLKHFHMLMKKFVYNLVFSALFFLQTTFSTDFFSLYVQNSLASITSIHCTMRWCNIPHFAATHI